jgi:antirestriction protein ArdC
MSLDVYGIVTEQIVKALDEGTVPWHRPWDAAAGAPRNAVSKKAYRGINVWLLGLFGARYESNYWLSYKQAQQLGGNVRKGEKALQVIFWKVETVRKGDPDENGDAPTGRRFILRYYNVWNVEQCDLPERIWAKLVPPKAPQWDRIERAEVIVAAMPKAPTIREGGEQAYYVAASDVVNMPKRDRFKVPAEYYSTLFHELGHSTGHKSRLDRASITDVCPFGSTNYSREELVAEMTAAFLCGVAGIENATVLNSAAYIKGWLGALKNDRKMVVLAAAQAQRAADYILDRKAEEEASDPEVAVAA